MDTEQMHQILVLQRLMNFKRASEELGISQPALSYQVKKVEEEIGFRIFDRSGKNVTITPAGEQFCISLREIREDYKRAVERGQNIDGRYRSSIRLGIPFRSVIPRLPDAIRSFYDQISDISIVTDFHDYGDFSGFLAGENDLEFMLEEDAKGMKGVDFVPLYRSGISLIIRNDDPLAEKDLIHTEDLQWRTLMVGGGSPPALRKVQQRIVATEKVNYFNSPDHDTTLTNVAVGSGVCLAPDFLHMEGDGFTWIPFDCDEGFDCVLAIRDDCSESIRKFADTVADLYRRWFNHGVSPEESFSLQAVRL